MAPPADQSPRRVELSADLSLEISDGQSQTTAHVTGSGSNLVLDVADPITLFRALPSGDRRGLVRQLPTDALGATSLEITSQGRRLARVTVSANRRLRVRPTWAGLATAIHPARSSLAGRLVVAGLVTAAVGIVLRRLRDGRAAG